MMLGFGRFFCEYKSAYELHVFDKERFAPFCPPAQPALPCRPLLHRQSRWRLFLSPQKGTNLSAPLRHFPRSRPTVSGYCLVIAGAMPLRPSPPFSVSPPFGMANTKVGAGVKRSGNFQPPSFRQGVVPLPGSLGANRSPRTSTSHKKKSPLRSVFFLLGARGAFFSFIAQSVKKKRFAPLRCTNLFFSPLFFFPFFPLDPYHKYLSGLYTLTIPHLHTADYSKRLLWLLCGVISK